MPLADTVDVMTDARWLACYPTAAPLLFPLLFHCYFNTALQDSANGFVEISRSKLAEAEAEVRVRSSCSVERLCARVRDSTVKGRISDGVEVLVTNYY